MARTKPHCFSRAHEPIIIDADATLAAKQALPSLPTGVTFTTDLATNVLYYGDNLDILRRYLPDAGVDLVYLDPPFNSNRNDNVIFRDESGNATDAQLLAFADTWRMSLM